MKLPDFDKMKSFTRKMARSLQIDTDRSYLLEMNSEGNLRVTGITDIKSYDESSVLVLSEKFITEIKGSGLFMQKFSDSEINVSGEILTINFIKR